MLRPLIATLALTFAGIVSAAQTAPAEVAPAVAAPAEVAAAEPEPTQKTGVLLDKVIAVVDSGVVTLGELEEQVAAVTQRLREQGTAQVNPSVLRSQILDRLILQELQLQKADRAGVKVTDEELNDALRGAAERAGITLAQLPQQMAAAGIDYQIYREGARKEMTMERLRVKEVRRNIRLSARELDLFIEKIKRLPDPDAEYNTSHILLALPEEATQAQVEETIRKAESLIERAKTEEFSALAVANSNSVDNLEGGALGWRRGQELPTLFQDVVVGLKPGEVSKPLLDPYGVHLVRLNEKRSMGGDPIEDQVHSRHILMRTNELQDDATVRLKLANIRERVLKGEDFAVFASTMSEDKGSGADGGDLDWKGPGSFVPEFEAELAKLGDNEISQPFQTEHGWHIVQVLGRRKFDTTEEALRERAYMQLVQSREQEETELWLRRLRDEAYIETSM